LADIVLFGVGGTAQVLHYHLTRAGHRVVAFVVDADYLREASLAGRPVVAFEDVAGRYPPQEHQMMIAVGYARVNRLRAERCAQAKAMGYRLFSYVSPTATVWDGCPVGEHCKIGEASIVQPYAQLGANVFIGSGCIVGHHSVLGDHCFLASRVTLGGGVMVEPYAFVGTGATVRNKAKIARGSVIGAGAVLLHDTRENEVCAAADAQVLPVSSDALSPG
jgi:sugar O-acyltransferase (sialic acid O-acetyltransferase NeuD family)